jgi:hypothetical protein
MSVVAVPRHSEADCCSGRLPCRRRWRAFLYDRHGDSRTRATGTAWERTRWHTTQCAAWEASERAAANSSVLLDCPSSTDVRFGGSGSRSCLHWPDGEERKMDSSLPQVFMTQRTHIHAATTPGVPSVEHRVLTGLTETQLPRCPHNHASGGYIISISLSASPGPLPEIRCSAVTSSVWSQDTARRAMAWPRPSCTRSSVIT